MYVSKSGLSGSDSETPATSVCSATADDLEKRDYGSKGTQNTLRLLVKLAETKQHTGGFGPSLRRGGALGEAQRLLERRVGSNRVGRQVVEE